MTYTIVSYDALERARRRVEKERDRRARAKAENRYDHRLSHHAEPRFVGWDGEGPRDTGYSLFGNSDGVEICKPFLSTIDCLDMLLAYRREHENTINVWFGGDYDVSMILKDLPRRCMTALGEYGSTVWQDYYIEHVPHKWFQVRRGEVQIKIYDIHSFFNSGYYDALESWKIGTPEEREKIRLGKLGRADFLWIDIESIRDYFRLELRLMPLLCNRLRDVFADAGYVPKAWYGPGALARMALQRHSVYTAMAATPDAVSTAARHAFAGGRFELPWAGRVNGKVYNYDIHSAYPHFATKLPNLARGTWRKARKFEPGKFGVWHISYNAPSPENTNQLYPLWRRERTGDVVWSFLVRGWYWEPEAALVADDPYARIEEGWVFDEDDASDRPFAWLSEYYLRRQRLKNNGSAAEYTFKLIINSVYGQLAQRVGWDRESGKPPKTHQLEFAGYITSACRAAVYSAARTVGDKCLSIDTDGIFTTTPVEGLELGDNLGQWELSEYDDAIFWQSGVYCLKSGDTWSKSKTRGIPKGTYTPEEVIEALKTPQIPLVAKRNKFIGYRQANNGQWQRKNSWILDVMEMKLGGGGKRQHAGRKRYGSCNPQCHDEIHACLLVDFTALDYRVMKKGTIESQPHYLPWLDNAKLMTRVKEIGEFVVMNEEDPDREEIGWVKAIYRPRQPTEKDRSNVSVAARGTRLRKKLGSLFSLLTG